MASYVCFLAVLIGASIGHAADVQPARDWEVFLSANQALADVDRLHVVVSMCRVGQEARQLEISGLKAGIADKLSEAGINRVEDRTSLFPTLVVRIEGMAAPDCEKDFWRVQASLIRLVMLPSRPGSPLQAEVWQGRPTVAVAAPTDAAEAVSNAVWAQVGVFVDACKGAHNLRELGQDDSRIPVVGQTPANLQSSQIAAGYLFVSSRNSSVFHRPDCRWAQNIASGNLVGYKSREEAVQAGKRPCKTCKP